MRKEKEILNIKKNRLNELIKNILPDLHHDFSNAKSNITKKFLMNTMFELENEKTTLIIELSNMCVIVGEAYEFLFEEENNKYDKEYNDYI